MSNGKTTSNQPPEDAPLAKICPILAVILDILMKSTSNYDWDECPDFEVPVRDPNVGKEISTLKQFVNVKDPKVESILDKFNGTLITLNKTEVSIVVPFLKKFLNTTKKELDHQKKSKLDKPIQKSVHFKDDFDNDDKTSHLSSFKLNVDEQKPVVTFNLNDYLAEDKSLTDKSIADQIPSHDSGAMISLLTQSIQELSNLTYSFNILKKDSVSMEKYNVLNKEHSLLNSNFDNLKIDSDRLKKELKEARNKLPKIDKDSKLASCDMCKHLENIKIDLPNYGKVTNDIKATDKSQTEEQFVDEYFKQFKEAGPSEGQIEFVKEMLVKLHEYMKTNEDAYLQLRKRDKYINVVEKAYKDLDKKLD